MSPARIEYINQLARGWVEEGVHPALVVLVARRGVICLHEAFGTLTSEPGSPPLAKDSIFPLMSATKPITAACVMLLIEDGVVGLMRPVREYFPEISAPGTDEVLIHHLLSHLSGWTDFDVATEIARRLRNGGDAPAPQPGQHPDIAAYLRFACGTPLAAGPGEAMQYCQLNNHFLADLVRRAGGKPIELFARERIFEPLGMGDSSYVLPPEHRERKVRRGEGMPNWTSAFFPGGVDSERFEGQPWGSGGVHTTARDYAVFAQMLLNKGTHGGRRVLSRASVDAMTRNQLPPGVRARWTDLGPDGEARTREFPGGYCYGLFPFLGTATPYFNGGLASSSSFSHAGALGIYWWVDPERDLVGVYFSVAARFLADGVTEDRRSDLFVDAVTAAVED